MTKTNPLVISGAVEGTLDEIVVRRLVEMAGASLGRVYGKNGKPNLRERLEGYNQAARFAHWVVLVDLDQDAECAPLLKAAWLPRPETHMCFRIAVREVEAWLIADRERLARFLSVPIAQIPQEPETLANPKRTMVDIARKSRRAAMREDMVPRAGSGRPIGPAYTSRMIEFVEKKWRPGVAEHSSDSLRRCRRHLLELLRP